MTTPFKLKNGAQFLSTEAPGGIYNASQLKKLAELCEEGAAFVKATEDQRLALILPDEQVETTREQLRALGVTMRPYMSGVHQPTSCIGELCPDSEQDALTTAIDVSQELDNIQSTSPLRIGINGCAKCCVPCHTLDIAVMGESSGYRVTLGGKNSHLPELGVFMAEAIPSIELPKILRNVVEAYQSTANEGETLQEVLERCGSSAFVQALAPYSQDAGGGTMETTGAPDLALAESADDGLTLADESSMDGAAVPEMLVSESGDIEGEGLSLEEAPAMDEVPVVADELAMDAAPVMEDALPEEDIISEEPTVATPMVESPAPQDHLTDDGLAAAEQAVEEKLLNDDDEVLTPDDGLTAVPAEMSIDTATLTMAPETALDINPSKARAPGILSMPDINPSAQRNTSAVMKSDVIIADEPSDSPETMGAPAVSEDEENQFEADLEVSIAEEKVVEAGSDTEDDDATERQKTLSIVQGSLDGEVAPVAADAENIEISEGDSQTLDLTDMELEPEVINDEDYRPIEADAPQETAVSTDGSGWDLAALIPQGDSSIEFQFDSGAKVTFDLSRLDLPSSGRTFRVGSQEFHIVPQGDGFSVATGGMSVTLPGKKAA